MGLKLQIGPVINRGKHGVSVGIRAGWSRARAGIRRLLCSLGASLEEHRAREGGEGAAAGKRSLSVDRGHWQKCHVTRAGPTQQRLTGGQSRESCALCEESGRPTRGSELPPAAWLLPRPEQSMAGSRE